MRLISLTACLVLGLALLTTGGCGLFGRGRGFTGKGCFGGNTRQSQTPQHYDRSQPSLSDAELDDLLDDAEGWRPTVGQLVGEEPLTRDDLPESWRGLNDKELTDLRRAAQDLAFDYYCAENYGPACPLHRIEVALALILNDGFMYYQALSFHGYSARQEGFTEESLACYKCIVDNKDDPEMSQNRDDALSGMAEAYCDLGEYDKALECTAAALECQGGLEGGQGAAEALVNTAEIYMAMEDWKKAMGVLNQAMVCAERADYPFLQSYILYFQGNCLLQQEDYVRARGMYVTMQDIAAPLNNPLLHFLPIQGLGRIEMELDDLESARGYFQDAVEMAVAEDDRKLVAFARSDLGRLLKEQGQYFEALGNFELARACWLELGLAENAGIEERNCAWTYNEMGCPAEAEARYRSALELLREEDPDLVPVLNGELAGVLADGGRFDEAISAYRAAIGAQPVEEAEDDEVVEEHFGWREGLIECYLAGRDWDEAEREITATLDMRKQLSYEPEGEDRLMKLRVLVLAEGDKVREALAETRKFKGGELVQPVDGQVRIEYLVVNLDLKTVAREERCSLSGSTEYGAILAFVQQAGEDPLVYRIKLPSDMRLDPAGYIEGLVAEMYDSDDRVKYQAARSLSSLLIDPLRASLPGEGALLFCPDDVLAEVSFVDLVLDGHQPLYELYRVRTE